MRKLCYIFQYVLLFNLLQLHHDVALPSINVFAVGEHILHLVLHLYLLWSQKFHSSLFMSLQSLLYRGRRDTYSP
jgi:hypothetical protein